MPVVNPGPLTYKMVETMLGLGHSHSRLAHPRPMVEKPGMIHAMLRAAADYEKREAAKDVAGSAKIESAAKASKKTKNAAKASKKKAKATAKKLAGKGGPKPKKAARRTK